MQPKRHPLILWAGVPLLSALTLAGLLIPPRLGFAAWLPPAGVGRWVMMAALLLGLSALFAAALTWGRHRPFRLAPALLFALMVALDRSFLARGDWGLLFGDARTILLALCFWLSLSATLYAAISLTAGLVLGGLARSQKAAGWSFRRFLMDFGILLLLWLPSIVLEAPGAVETTAGQQIRQGFGELPYATDNPIFLTLLMKAVIKATRFVGLGDTMAVMNLSLLQILPLASALAWAVGIARRVLPVGFARLLLAVYALFPVYPFYGFFIVKDVPFAILTLVLTCELAELAIHRQGFFTTGRGLAAHVAIGLALCATRSMAMAMYALVWLIALPLLRLKSRTSLRLFLGALAAIALCAAGTAMVHRALDAQTLENRQAETRSLQLQIVARIVSQHREGLSGEELAELDACVPLESIAFYQPEVSDPVKDAWRTNTTATQRRAFDRLSLNLALRYPATAAQAALRMAVPYLALGDAGRFRAIFDYGFSDVYHLYPVFHPRYVFRGEVFGKPLFRILPDFFQNNPIVLLISSSGLYASLLLGSLALLLRRRQGRWVGVCLPALLTLLGCLMSPVAGYVRYALPFIFTAPLLAALAAAVLGRLADGGEGNL
ncbi:MAG: hypothetical protein GXY67_11250 [Clostridiales bacterium]|nr:hypothetical protein [Clostridiales bacterium]